MATFVSGYLRDFQREPLKILDLGSQVVDADPRSYKCLFDNADWHYTGIDITEGRNVDICISDPYLWKELPCDSFDVVISGQTLEHVPFFWSLVYEVGRVLRPGGLACLIAPSGGHEHRYPVDCWRFYPDGFSSLTSWLGFDLLDASTDWSHYWGDSVLVMRKPHWNPDERHDFQLRWRSLMSVLPSSPCLDSIAFPNSPTASLLSDCRSGVFDAQNADGRGKLRSALHRVQSATLELLGPQMTRAAIDVRNELRSRNAKKSG